VKYITPEPYQLYPGMLIQQQYITEYKEYFWEERELTEEDITRIRMWDGDYRWGFGIPIEWFRIEEK